MDQTWTTGRVTGAPVKRERQDSSTLVRRRLSSAPLLKIAAYIYLCLTSEANSAT